MKINDQEFPMNFKFAVAIERELKEEEKDGFNTLIEGLLNRDILILVKGIKVLMSASGVTSEEKVAEILETTFEDDKATDQLFDDFFENLVSQGFLRQRLVSYVKEMKRNLKLSEEVIPSLKEEERIPAEVGIQQMNQTVCRLEKIIRKDSKKR